MQRIGRVAVAIRKKKKKKQQSSFTTHDPLTYPIIGG